MKSYLWFITGLILSAGVSRAQDAAPYNPDANNDQFINTPDLVTLLALYNNPFFVPDNDLDPFNELQTLVLDGNTLSLEPGRRFGRIAQWLERYKLLGYKWQRH